MEQKMAELIGEEPRVAISATRQIALSTVGIAILVALAGSVLAGAFEDAPSILVWAVTGGVVGAVIFGIGEFQARRDDQPGGWGAALAVTDRELIVASRNSWLGRVEELVARLPLSSIDSVSYQRSVFKQSVVIQQGDVEWEWRSPKIGKLAEVLPAR